MLAIMRFSYSTAAQIMNIAKTTRGYDKVFEKLNILSLKDGNLAAEIKISEEHLNSMGGLHDGFSATIVDTMGTVALESHKNNAGPSVSVDIHVTYLKGAKLGDEVTVDVRTVRTGKNLAFLETLLKNKISGELLVKGNHTKFFLRNNEKLKST